MAKPPKYTWLRDLCNLKLQSFQVVENVHLMRKVLSPVYIVYGYKLKGTYIFCIKLSNSLNEQLFSMYVESLGVIYEIYLSIF